MWLLILKVDLYCSSYLFISSIKSHMNDLGKAKSSSFSQAGDLHDGGQMRYKYPPDLIKQHLMITQSRDSERRNNPT